MKQKPEGMIVLKTYKLTKELGSGAFGKIYLAINTNNPDQFLAIKLEDANTKSPQLFYQYKLYKHLNNDDKDHGIPRVYEGSTEGVYNIMVMDLLGKSLEDLFVEQNKKFSVSTTLQVAQQILQRIEFLHSRQFIHRDLKPDNFLMGRGKNNWKIYMIDFGLSKKYIRQGSHIPYKEGKDLTGTARYASINTHIGIDQSRRDDMESIGYILLYFLRGILPWQNMKAKDTQSKYRLIKEKKQSTSSQQLCKGFPQQFVTYLQYTKSLKFQQQPNYSYCRKLFETARKREGVELDWSYDWTKVPNKPMEVQKPSSLNKPSNQQNSSKKLNCDKKTDKNILFKKDSK